MAKIVDEAGLLPAEAIPRLNAAMLQAEQGSAVEYVIRIVARVPGRGWRQQATYDRPRLSATPGKSILVLVAVEDRHVEIATAPCFNRLFDSATTNALLRAHFVPRMREGDLEGALLATVAAVAQQLAAGPVAAARARPRNWPGALILAAVAALVLGIPTCVFINHRICPNCRSWGSYESRVIVPATESIDGQGKDIFDCRNCGLHRVETVILPVRSGSDGWSSGSDGGSDSGGGSDGGGGADW